MHAKARSLNAEIKNDISGIKKGLEGLSASQKTKNAFDAIKASAQKAAQAAVDASKGNGESLAAYEKLAALMEKGEKLRSELGTPLDKFNSDMSDFNELLQAGALDWEHYTRAIGKATDELSKATKLGETKAPEAVLSGSKEAFSAVARFQREGGDNAQERMANLLEAALAVHRAQLAANKETADALKSITVSDLD